MPYSSKRSSSILSFVVLLFSCGTGPHSNNKATALFSLLPADSTQVTFANTLTEGPNTNILLYEYFYNGGGVAAGDFNGDGLSDLYFTSNMGGNVLYLNRGGMHFEDVTAQTGAAGRPGPWKTGVSTVDINGDGRLDIYLCYSGAMPAEKRKNQFFINLGNNGAGAPMFEDRAEQYGLASSAFSNQSYFVDYDRDGDLDMLLLNHNPKNLPFLNEEGNAQLLKTDSPDKGLRLFKQDGGHFEDVTVAAGINGSELSYGLGLALSDLDGDGWPDFYVSNDYAVPDYIYMNNRNGTFTNKLSSSVGHTSQFSMGNDVSDMNNDGRPDIFTLDMLPEDNRRQKLLMAPDNYEKFDLNVRSGFYYQYMRNMLHLNNGDGTFSEMGQMAGVSNTDWSWSALFADYDNDGWKDLYITNGYLRDFTNQDFIFYMNEYVRDRGRLSKEDVMNIIKEMPSSNVRNYMFRNRTGRTFEKANEPWGLTETSNSNGAVYVDLDNDGDLDLVVNNINQPAFLYRNNAGQQNANHHLRVSLHGVGGNAQGIGARVSIYHGSEHQALEQYPTRGYLSSVGTTLNFGLGSVKQVDSVIVRWNSGRVQTLKNVHADTVISFQEKDAVDDLSRPTAVSPMFMTAHAIEHRDSAAQVNDFDRQPLLISAFSFSGPCMRRADMNGDGREDLIIGKSGPGHTSLYIQSPDGKFTERKLPAFLADSAHVDGDIAVFDADHDGRPDIYITSGGYHHFEPEDSLLQDRLYLNTGNGFVRGGTIPHLKGSRACVRAEDINGDGAIDLFLGGRVMPGAYPLTPPSYLLMNDGKGNFTDKTNELCPSLSTAGMVTDATWIDLDMNGIKELVVAGEWMPLTIYVNTNGKLTDKTSQFLPRAYKGWWTSLHTGDFNQDGRPDLVVGNWGLNAQFHASPEEPMELFAPDLDRNGRSEPVFSYYNDHRRYPYLTRDELISQAPSLKKRFATYKSYADVTLEELAPMADLERNGHWVADHMATTIFLSGKDGKLIPGSLPDEIQYSPVFSWQSLDVDCDGKLDLLAFGNQSHAKIKLGKFDANYGQLFLGDGKGGFTYVDQTKSGLQVRGDVRSSALVGDLLILGIQGRKTVAYKLTHRK